MKKLLAAALRVNAKESPRTRGFSQGMNLVFLFEPLDVVKKENTYTVDTLIPFFLYLYDERSQTETLENFIHLESTTSATI
ncbi:hypothetical protein POKO110462_22205 [Pontibacter korlensis]|uniref:hypothetical protein n=2 Tax=Pontibacter korlensis TaxID=400092 RepID=UPI00061B2A60|nr:hypothetical protein [Pontibacter korlensis]